MSKAKLQKAEALELLKGLSIDDQADIDIAFGRASSDADVGTLFSYLLKQGPVQRNLANELLNEVAPFYLDSDDRVMRLFAEVADRRQRKSCEKTRLLKAHNNDLTGVELMSSDGSRFALFLPDASQKGQVRVQFFDRQGFSGHCTRKNYSECIDEALSCGISVETQGNLDVLSEMPEFVAGNERVSRMAQLNTGQITWHEFAKAD